MSEDESKKETSYLPTAWDRRPGDRKRPGESHRRRRRNGASKREGADSSPPDVDEQSSTARTDQEAESLGRAEDSQEKCPEHSCGHRCPAREMDGSANPCEEDGDSEDAHVSARVRAKIAGVRFSRAGKIYHFEAGDLELAQGDFVIVKTEKGMGLGLVAISPRDTEIEEAHRDALRSILRKAAKADFDQKARCAQREIEARAYCLERIEALGLPMKLVSVESFFDGSKYVFYFTAEGRVDFRELVKQLVARFPVRIEMRQIGVRHEAKMTGGIASCGQELCCCRFLTDFRPVSVKMAKTQNLSLNPTKISGVCGRLMCCLAYEHEIYEQIKKGLPKVGKTVSTSEGEGAVVKYNPLKETVCIRLEDDTLVDVTRDKILQQSDSLSKDNRTNKKPRDKQQAPRRKQDQEELEETG